MLVVLRSVVPGVAMLGLVWAASALTAPARAEQGEPPRRRGPAA